MSQKHRPGAQAVETELRALEKIWQTRLPETFRKLHLGYDAPLLPPCEFLSPAEMVRGEGRAYGMLPALLPFGREMDEGGIFGFYALPGLSPEQWPVLCWDTFEMSLQPAASNFCAFLRNCVLTGRYAAEEQEEVEGELEQEYSALLVQMGMTDASARLPLPRSDAELYHALTQMDPQNAVSLCHMGCARRAQNDPERALDLYFRAAEAAPWFGDPFYLIADIYREREDSEHAAMSWWSVAQRLLPLCTSTLNWDLGMEHPEADIYEVAADGLASLQSAPEEMRADPLWNAVTREDPYDPHVREALAHLYMQQGRMPEAEREYINALSLCCEERDSQSERLYNSLIVLYENQGRSREAALAAADAQRKQEEP